MDLEPKTKMLASSLVVSVVIPTFNRRDWIGECLDSVLAQTYKNIEIIVIDDCSTDGTAKWLRSQIRFQAVTIHEQPVNGGASVARNTAIAMARGELIVFIDSDDLLLPQHIEKAAEKFVQYPDLGLFCCDSTMIDVKGEIILSGKTWHQVLAANRNIKIESGFRSLKDVFAFSNCFPGFTLRREVFHELGGFDQSIFPADDYDLALRVAGSNWKVYYLHEPLCLRREHNGQCSGIENSVKTQLKLIEALEKSVERDPNALKGGPLIRRRMASVNMELGISEIKEGRRIAGIGTIIGSLLTNPTSIGMLAKVGRRKILNAFGYA